MNTWDAEVFLKIKETQSISLAAEHLFVSQSAVSQRLHALEKELGVQLVHRKKGQHSIDLTLQGEKLVPLAKTMLAQYKDMRELKLEEAQLHINIGAVDWLNSYIFTPLYRKIFENVKNVVTIFTRPSKEVYTMLVRQDIDIGFVVFPFHFQDIRTSPIFSEELCLLCNQYSQYPKCSIHPRQLNPRNELRWNYIPSYSQWHDKWFEPDIPPQIVLDSAALAVNLLSNLQYWVIVPRSVADFFRFRQDICAIPLEEPPEDFVCYQIEHTSPRPNRIDSINKLKRYLGDFIAERREP